MDYKTRIKLISWNVRGLNDRSKRLSVRETFFLNKPDIICLQETKLSTIDDVIRREICGRRISDYALLPARGTRGGILVAWQAKRFKKVAQTNTEYCLTVTLQDTMLGETFLLTGVYGPNNSAARRLFFQELREVRTDTGTPWIVCGDFNTTLEVNDRNSASADWRWPLAFTNLISELELQDIRMRGRRYTWSSSRQRPAMAKLDRFLVSADWSARYPNPI